MPTLSVAVDRDRGPEAPARRRHTLLVEPPGDGARRITGKILGEDPADDRGFRLDDLQLAGLAWNRPIAISPAASAAAVANDAGEAASNLLSQPLQEQCRHRALEPDMHLADLAVGDGDELHAGELRGLIEPGDIGEIAREPVEILGQDHIELPGKREADQPLIVRPAMDRGSRCGAVGEYVSDAQVLASRVGVAKRELVLDRAVTLQIGREPGVEGRACHSPS
ncbi:MULTISPECIES: hypothetical protein [unclassified Bosea (in: a-proteobacteria)]|uniref:hypothetical protein n=1 Tax=unclassified Bosea (in: a-proteobacteria) TaxID=2653178 RepID=UPI001FCEAAF1|nr:MULTISPECIES: hypothetical protein [unclassified Bosea (in: a-proteobacteria)]